MTSAPQRKNLKGYLLKVTQFKNNCLLLWCPALQNPFKNGCCIFQKANGCSAACLLVEIGFLQFFPDLVKNGHVYILETPLFRVRDKKETIYCYDENGKDKTIIKGSKY